MHEWHCGSRYLHTFLCRKEVWVTSNLGNISKNVVKNKRVYDMSIEYRLRLRIVVYDKSYFTSNMIKLSWNYHLQE